MQGQNAGFAHSHTSPRINNPDQHAPAVQRQGFLPRAGDAGGLQQRRRARSRIGSGIWLVIFLQKAEASWNDQFSLILSGDHLIAPLIHYGIAGGDTLVAVDIVSLWQIGRILEIFHQICLVMIREYRFLTFVREIYKCFHRTSPNYYSTGYDLTGWL